MTGVNANGDVDEFNARQIGKMMVDLMTVNTSAQFTYKRGDHAITLQSRSSLGVDGERVQLQVDKGRVHTDNFTRRAYRSRTVRVGLPVYTLRPLRRVRPVHSDHIRMCSQWTRTVRGGLPVYTLRRVRPVHSDHIRMCSQWTRTVRVGLAL